MAATSKSPFLFDDVFDIEAINPDGKKFDKGESPQGCCVCVDSTHKHVSSTCTHMR